MFQRGKETHDRKAPHCHRGLHLRMRLHAVLGGMDDEAEVGQMSQGHHREKAQDLSKGLLVGQAGLPRGGCVLFAHEFFRRAVISGQFIFFLAGASRSRLKSHGPPKPAQIPIEK